jgi:two-component system, NtrC family, response regulator GlrR
MLSVKVEVDSLTHRAHTLKHLRPVIRIPMVDKHSAGRTTDTKVPPSTARTDRVLVIAGEAAAQRVMVSRLSSAGYTVDAVATVEEARAACAQHCPDLIILDLDVQRAGGLPLLKELKGSWPDLLVIVITNLMSLEKGVRATQCGAFSYLVKPVEKAELLDHVKRAIGAATSAPPEHDWRADLAARSQLREERITQLNEVAARDHHVLLTGENSLGRELVARALHAASSRRDSPLLVLRCGTGTAGEFWPDPELFSRAVLNALSSAQGGTLLIDEIDTLPESTQLTLAAASDDVRLIATTSFDARDLVASGRLQASLYEKLAGQSLVVPPLGRRREDIPLLISYFLEQATEPGGNRTLYSPDAVATVIAKNWPANIRELFELVGHNPTESGEYALLMGSEPTDSSFDEAREAFSRQYLSETLRMTEGNVSKSARLAKRNRTDFYKLMEKYRLRPDDFKVSQEGR